MNLAWNIYSFEAPEYPKGILNQELCKRPILKTLSRRKISLACFLKHIIVGIIV